ncbi:glucose/quinate/shikimate family membrane-bound PQQ-dependent dehydrogenase [Terrihabitans sp. B22-R8]|uniref:glucose/quinate/shikimate family membrane-bound PQQ-dependent dehydrogenase n=1 Tax=Terrihabitans sp. B22-R8 TaxID=3425128 RepID=UPI00403C133B
MISTITGVFALLMGLALGAGGAWLIALGGSWYYVIAGILMALTGVQLFRRQRSALLVYAVLVIGTLLWALYEVGFDWWQLAPRGGIIILFGLWLLTPWVRAGFGRQSVTDPTPDRWARGTLAASVLIALVVAGASMLNDPHSVEGRLPLAANLVATPTSVPDGEWHQYGRTNFGQRYSPLAEITPDNVSQLETAWTYRTGDIRGPQDVPETTYQVTPLKIGDLLYLCTPHHIAIALDAATGEERWRFDPKVPMENQRQHQTCRGVSYYADASAQPGASCAQRLYLPTSDARLIALDALNGQVCPTFANEGTLDLMTNMPFKPDGYYYSTSPPVIANGLVIVGGAVNDNYSNTSPSGVIRAYDVNTGALVWNWDAGNPDRTAPLGPDETYTANSPNSWSISSADEELGLVYIPLGNQTPDQLGMNRSENVERFSSSIVALDIATGQLRWVRQTVHHDLWDMDVPAQPVLIDLNMPAGPVPALIGPTKQGDIYVLDRRTGEPIIPITEEPAPGGAIPEDHSAPTQPLSALTFNPPKLTEASMWGATMFDQLSCRIQFQSLNYLGRYTPPSVKGTLVYPGNFGVFNWGSVAVDPVRQVMFGMPTYLAFTSRLVPRDQVPPPGDDEKGSEQGLNRNEGSPYGVYMGPFLSALGLPCQAPPWGYVAGVDLQSGEIAWKHKNGTVRDASPVPLPIKMGVPGIGGPMITAGGVAFLAAAIDDYLRAYDLTSGEQLWQARLPAGGQATPMSYSVGEDQYIVIVAGGHGSVGTRAGDYVIAYRLKKAH